MRRLLITGGTGQVGIALLRQPWPEDVEFLAPGRDQLDLSSRQSVEDFIAHGPWDCVINCAAYTAVDEAEENEDAALLANRDGPSWLAKATAGVGVPLIHVSTDYVFSGNEPGFYSEEDAVDPIGVYGASKAAGEQEVMRSNPRSVILRTAWVLSAHRSNFAKTMLRLAARQTPLRVVADQRGCPTSATDIAKALIIIADRLMTDPSAPTGIYHFVNSGEASWHELAVEIFRLSAEHGGPSADVTAISTNEFPTRARRPANSRLSTVKIARDFGVSPRDWHEAVADIVAELGRTNELKEFAR